MKRFLLAVFLLSAVQAGAQELEIGVGGGFSTNTAPDGNLRYKQDQSILNYAGTLKFLYTSYSNWQYGFDGHVVELAGKTTKPLPGTLTDTVGGDNKKVVYAKYGISVCGVLNRAFRFKDLKSYAYLGVALGYGAARNNPQEYTTAETYNTPDGGRGIVFGGQAGYVGTLSEKLSFNLDIAVRRYDFKYDAGAPYVEPREDLHYNIMAFPITVGLRYFIARSDRRMMPRYNETRPMGRASY